MSLLSIRRSLLRRRGRTMTLTRASSTVSLLGFSRAYGPNELVGGIIQGDRTVEILNDEIAAASWPGPPKKGDRIAMDGLTYVLQGSESLYDGAVLVGHRLWVRGG